MHRIYIYSIWYIIQNIWYIIYNTDYMIYNIQYIYIYIYICISCTKENTRHMSVKWQGHVGIFWRPCKMVQELAPKRVDWQPLKSSILCIKIILYRLIWESSWVWSLAVAFLLFASSCIANPLACWMFVSILLVQSSICWCLAPKSLMCRQIIPISFWYWVIGVIGVLSIAC